MRQIWGVAGGFFLVFIAISLTNKPHVNPRGIGSRGSTQSGQTAAPDAFYKGYSFVPAVGAGLADDRTDRALGELAGSGATWVAFTPTLFQDTGTSNEVAPDAELTPSKEALAHAFGRCRAVHLQIMLRPLVVAKDGTRREDFTPADAAQWLASYTKALDPWLDAAAENGVAIVCLGSSYAHLEADPGWGDAIRRARGRFSGKLTYAALPDTYQNVPFWTNLDYVGIDAYFPLSSAPSPAEGDLEAGWNRAAGALEIWQQSLKPTRPILFASVGFPSLAGAAAAPNHPDLEQRADDETQAAAARTFFKVFHGKPWLAGTFWNAWSADSAPSNPFAIQGRPAFQVLKQAYQE